jgi:hypothetical protein
MLLIFASLPLKTSKVYFLAVSIDSGLAFGVAFLSGITADCTEL